MYESLRPGYGVAVSEKRGSLVRGPSYRDKLDQDVMRFTMREYEERFKGVDF